MSAHGGKPTARTVALTIGAGRLALGAGILAARRPALRALGFPPADDSAATLATLAGSRDVVLGLLPLLVRGNPAALRTATALAAVVDAADLVAFAAAGREPGLRRASISGMLSAGFGAAAGLWAASRLR
ncbi:MAG TPA: DUF4267 domain-containing protein [Solirubrobacterales bacterium]|nr:DUF4267 domain-containing protein [Solirubrobacterales bacterium]